MTCFRTKDGKSIRSQCKNDTEYSRFYKAIEKGATTEEAFRCRTIPQIKGHPHTLPFLRILEVLQNYNRNNYFIIKGYCYRHKCSVEEALKWAARTGRVTVKHQYRQYYLQRKEK